MVKEPNVSGQFYSSDPKELTRMINFFSEKANVDSIEGFIDIVIAPHAGYVYSGPVAAYSFNVVKRKAYRTIIVLAPSHRLPFNGISIWPEGGFKTPLGTLPVDKKLSQQILNAHKQFYFEPKAFDGEHSLEVELPFIQETFNDVSIVPVVMGQPSYALLEKFAETLDLVIGERKDILIVVSTDFSHYHPYEKAKRIDFKTIEAIKNLESERIWKECHLKTMEMCGYVPVTAALLYAKRRGLNNVKVLSYANSGDTSGMKSQVVGYSAIAIYRDPNASKQQLERIGDEAALNPLQKNRLLQIARETIEQYVREGTVYQFKENDPRLFEEEGAFVTIHKHGRLRGCIGNITGSGPLCYLVRDLAISSATNDPRFRPLNKDEIKDIEV
ncbi:MAG: AmmeMemoRadiSam system protein B, partial [Candidatus Omnitrophica bacterium]|nr:AmmeMemoRadiSam system protein B [Candidatus Omnitrophota bacterium]